MYLVSIYFDEKTNKRIQQYINDIARITGNTYMLDGNVPPHITVASFETDREAEAVAMLEAVAKELGSGKIRWVSVGTFLPYVMYLAPVLNQYLHALSSGINEKLNTMDGVKISRFYQPFQWMPHTTIGKKLSGEELRQAFEVMQNQFGPFEGNVMQIGLAKTNPYRDVAVIELNDMP